MCLKSDFIHLLNPHVLVAVDSTPATFETPARNQAATPCQSTDGTKSPSTTELPEKDKEDCKSWSFTV